MEFGRVLWLTDWKVQVFPRAYDMEIFPGSAIKAKYGFVGIGASVISSPAPTALNLITDGMNDQGLSVATHSQYRAQYETTAAEKTGKVLWLFVASWLLGSFQNVEEVRDAVLSGHFQITNGPEIDFWQKLVRIGGTHWAIADKHGGSIVLEYERGQPRVYTNSVRVLTNDPFFPWHVEHLNSYSWLGWDSRQNERAKAIQAETQDLLSDQDRVPFNSGHGFNLGGPPGDHSPPARFVRTFFMKQISQKNSEKAENVWQAVALAQAVLNHVFIPQGSTGPDPDVLLFVCKLFPSYCKTRRHVINSDYSLWDTLRIPQQKWMAFRTYPNGQWSFINMTELDWSPRSWPIPHLRTSGFEDLNMKDITPLLNEYSTQTPQQI